MFLHGNCSQYCSDVEVKPPHSCKESEVQHLMPRNKSGLCLTVDDDLHMHPTNIKGAVIISLFFAWHQI